jgi:DNA mismatch repair protein MutS
MVVNSEVKLTPMMEQYFQMKKCHLKDIMLFRMGDFYEVFFDDAYKLNEILNITLTHRGSLGPFKIPMAGIPHHAATNYIDRITQTGLRVAICEQVEDPKESIGIVKRAIAQVAGPGIPYDLDRTTILENNFIGSALHSDGVYYLTLCDFTTGELTGLLAHSLEEFCENIRSQAPKEFLSFPNQWEDQSLVKDTLKFINCTETILNVDYFNKKFTKAYTKNISSGILTDKVLNKTPMIYSPLGALAYYLSSTQKIDKFVHFRKFNLLNSQNQLKVTTHSLQGLEILPKSKENYKQSLLGHMDKTQSSLGPRQLKKVFQTASTSLEEINKRQEVVKGLIENRELLTTCREELKKTKDLERILAKITNTKVNSNDLLNLGQTLTAFFQIQKAQKSQAKDKLSTPLLKKLTSVENKKIDDIIQIISKTINDELGASADKGNLIKEGANKKRDRLARLGKNALSELQELEAKYRKKTKINNLKIKSNNVAGFFVEVSKGNVSKVPASFSRRQTLVNSERYTTKELSEFEKEVLSAKFKLENIEREIFKEIVELVASSSKIILEMASNLANLDVYQSFATISIEEDFVCPTIKSSKKIMDINGAFHPLIKKHSPTEFVDHDISMGKKNFFGLITGPNMAGKTTVMREVAIIQFLAQIGSFVPASSATLGICDALFCRLGANDNILQGQSTFMVEMSETAEIIRHATGRSLILLDEVGRGTSTYDGLSIAWSLVEYLISKTKAITFFATHYHELIKLVDELDGAQNLTMEIYNNNGEINFLYKLIQGGAKESFGIYVAKIAGVPDEMLKRSEVILKNLEELNSSETEIICAPETAKNKKKNSKNKKKAIQLSFLNEENYDENCSQMAPTPKYYQTLEEELGKINIMNLTAVQAIAAIDGLQAIIQKKLQ